MKVPLCVGGGTAVTVAIAWALGAWHGLEHCHVVRALSSEQAPRWNFYRSQCMGVLRIAYLPHNETLPYYVSKSGVTLRFEPDSDLLPQWSVLHTPPSREEMNQGRMMIEDARGWPFLSMRCRYEALGSVDDIDQGILLNPNLAVDWVHEADRAIPLGIIPMGFIADTALFAIIVYGLHFVGCKAWQLFRRTKGLCPRCGYELRAEFAHGCPECGWQRA